MGKVMSATEDELWVLARINPAKLIELTKELIEKSNPSFYTGEAMSELVRRIRDAQVRAGEEAVMEHLRENGLLSEAPAAESAATKEELILMGGKYRFYKVDGALRCDRYGERWREFVGDKAILALFAYALESGAYRRALEDELVCAHIYSPTNESDPRRAISDLVEWNVQVALNPKVSSDARALIEMGRAAAAAEKNL